jgi:hypothetical protein
MKTYLAIPAIIYIERKRESDSGNQYYNAIRSAVNQVGATTMFAEDYDNGLVVSSSDEQLPAEITAVCPLLHEFASPKSLPTPTVTLPTLHMNGSGPRILQRTYDAAADTLQDFIDSWGNVEFNARDYYVVEGAWDKAVTEREAMNAKIRELRDYLQSIREHLHA